MALADRVTKITYQTILPALENQVLNKPSFLQYVVKKAAKFHTGGKFLEQPVKKALSTQGGSYAPGDTLDTNVENTRDSFVFQWKATHQPIAYYGIEAAANAGQAKVIDYITSLVEEAHENIWDDLSDQFYGDGTGNSGKNFTGLAAIVDDGTNVATYGGKTRSTDTWAAAGYAAVGGSITIPFLQQAVRGATNGSGTPTVATMGQVVFDAVEDLFQGTVVNNFNGAMANSSMTADGGREISYGGTALKYKGIPFISDQKGTAQKLYMLNADKLFYNILKPAAITDVPAKTTKQTGISMFPFQRPVDQDGLVTQLFTYGELTTSAPRAHYQLATIS